MSQNQVKMNLGNYLTGILIVLKIRDQAIKCLFRQLVVRFRFDFRKVNKGQFWNPWNCDSSNLGHYKASGSRNLKATFGCNFNNNCERSFPVVINRDGAIIITFFPFPLIVGTIFELCGKKGVEMKTFFHLKSGPWKSSGSGRVLGCVNFHRFHSTSAVFILFPKLAFKFEK